MIMDFDLSVICIAAIIGIISLLFLKLKLKKNNIYLFFWCVFYIYLIGVIKYTQFPIIKLPGMEQTVFKDMQLIPFVTLRKESAMQVIYNIIMLVPFGILTQCLKRDSCKMFIFKSIMAGIVIESLQLIIALIVGATFRVVDIDDVIFNAIGSMMGYGIFNIVMYIIAKFGEKSVIGNTWIYRYFIEENC